MNVAVKCPRNVIKLLKINCFKTSNACCNIKKISAFSPHSALMFHMILTTTIITLNSTVGYLQAEKFVLSEVKT